MMRRTVVVICAGALATFLGCGTVLTLDDPTVDEREPGEAGRDDSGETDGRAADDASGEIVEQEQDAAPEPGPTCVPLRGACKTAQDCCRDGGLLGGVDCYKGTCQTCLPRGTPCRVPGRCCAPGACTSEDDTC